VDPTALRLEEIRMQLDAAKFAIDLLAKRHLAVMGVAVAAVVSSALGWSSGQLRATAAGVLAVLAGGAAIFQLYALHRLSRKWVEAAAYARRTVRSLNRLKGEADVDGTEEAPDTQDVG